MTPDRCYKVLKFSPGGLALTLGGGSFRVTHDALPLVMEFVKARVVHDGRGQTLEILIASPQFDPVPDGEDWPEIAPRLESLPPPTP